MNKVKVISYQNKAASIPISWTLSIWLFMDKMGASPVLFGVFYAFITVVWALSIWKIIIQEQVDIFK